MNYAIVYCSRTGNTALLAERLKHCLPASQLVYAGPPSDEALKADVLFVGSWTDKGTCCPEIAQFLHTLNKKQVYLFGTAGFGGDPAYFARISKRFQENLPAGNTLLGNYFCQGKMPPSVRTRYEAIAQTDPEKAAPMLENFDRALTHPDETDLNELEKAVSEILG